MNITHCALQATSKNKQEQAMNNRRWNYCRQASTGNDTGTVFDPTS